MSAADVARTLPIEGEGIDALRSIWERAPYPVIFVQKKPPILVTLPYREDNYAWLRGDQQRKPKWIPAEKHWEVPKSWQGYVISKCVARFGAAIVIKVMPRKMEKCAPACWQATSDVGECVCSCGGINHGIESNPGGFLEIRESFAVRWSAGNRLVATLITEGGRVEVASADPGS
jgi:hypothetical protein